MGRRAVYVPVSRARRWATLCDDFRHLASADA